MATGISLALTMTAASLEGAYFLWDHWARGRDYWGFRVINVDGLTRWNWWLPPVDGIPRLFWYTPQHGMALTLRMVLLGVVIAASPAVRATAPRAARRSSARCWSWPR